MASTWDPNVGQASSEARLTLVQQLMTIAKMTQAIERIPDSENLRVRLADALKQLGIPDRMLTDISNNREFGSAEFERIDIRPIVIFALLKSTRALIDQRKYETARGLMGTLIVHFPENAEAHYLLARAEFGLEHDDLAETLFERAIALDTGRLESYSGLATLYERMGKYELAEKTWRRGFEFGAIFRRPYLGAGKPAARILVITSVLPGNIRFMRFLDTHEFDITSIIAESYTPNLILPEHDLILQAIGDADLCVRGIQIAEQIITRSGAPVINAPAQVMQTGSAKRVSRLRNIDNAVLPLSVTIDRSMLLADNAAATLAKLGLVFPVLMRNSRGRLEKADSQSDVLRIASSRNESRSVVTQFVDVEIDTVFSKYRVMGIGKKLYPVRFAAGNDWNVSYSPTGSAVSSTYAGEEAAFLDDAAAAIGEKAMQALSGIVAELDLEYCGIDFAIDPKGSVVVFSVSADIALPKLDEGSSHAAIVRAQQAAKQLIYERLPNVPIGAKPKAKPSKSRKAKARRRR